MSNLSSPKGLLVTGVRDDDQPHKTYLAIGKFRLEGEDAFWLYRLAEERNMTVEALVKVYIIEGLFRARSYREL